MADARAREKARLEKERQSHLARIAHVHQTEGPGAALDRAYDYFKAQRKKCTDLDEADRISDELFQFLIMKAAKFPRRSPE